MAFLVNAAILVLAGGAFYGRGLPLVTDLGQAYQLLTPMLGTSLASLAFGVGLLAAGQSSTITGTLAGQVVMEGFLDLRLPLWQRRLLTRGMALIPALATVLLLGEGATNQLLVLSQVVLSLQLPFAAVPLVWFCGQARPMGNLRSPLALQLLSWLCIGTIITINLSLLISLAGTLRF
jgi:manganese transport protein